ncbi:acetyl-CoA carboxylase biotin carboxyl carrier protein [Nocardiopsis aegyptia]|uniref:acetyl-CoA carboxylase biotin carboxyl carrier protein n=1 Tax=Nocardiopsis aegyptia TaxID=220378 RepID=UPI003671EAF9
MTLDVTEHDTAGAAAGGPGADGDPREVGAALDLVRGTMLDLLSGSPHPPSALRVHAGGVTIEAEWPSAATAGAAPVAAVAAPAVPAGDAAPPAQAAPAAADVPAGVRVASPAVGVLYLSPAPGEPPFVQEGDTVAEGRQVAIVEVMKLMIPVRTETAGRVVRVLKEDAAPVEFDEPLFVIDPAG